MKAKIRDILAGIVIFGDLTAIFAVFFSWAMDSWELMTIPLKIIIIYAICSVVVSVIFALYCFLSEALAEMEDRENGNNR